MPPAVFATTYTLHHMDLDELSQPLVENDGLAAAARPSHDALEQDVSVCSNEEDRKVPTLVFIVVPTISLIVVLFIAVLCMPPAQLPTTPNNKKSPIRVFVLAGQSNMVGHGYVSKKDEAGKELNGTLESLINTQPDQFGMLKSKKNVDETRLLSSDEHDVVSSSWTVRTDVLIACNYQAFDDPKDEETPKMHGNLFAGMCGGDEPHQNHMGPELGFGWSVGDAFNANKAEDNKVLLAKIAWGGKSLEVDFRPPSSGGSTGPYYTTMIYDIKSFFANVEKFFPEVHGRPVVLSGFGWHQGWNDLIDSTAAADYEKNLANFIRDVRKDLNVSDLPIAIASSGMESIKTNEKVEEVVHAEIAVAKYPEFNGTVTTVDTRGFRRKPPPASPGDEIYHWYNNCESYWLIGTSLGNAMVELVRRREKSNP
jgi:hypothetical protein